LTAQRLDPGLQLVVAIHLIHRFLPGAAHVGCLEQHHRHAVVDAGDLQAVNGVLDVAGGQQTGTDRAGGIQKVDGDGRRGAGHAVDTGVAVIGDMSIRRLHGDVAPHVGVERQHPHRGGRPLHRHQAAFDGEGNHGGQHVAAIGRGVDGVLVGLQLGEQEIDVDSGRGAGPHDADLAGQRMCPADPVDLPGMGRAHDRQQDTVAHLLVGGQVAFQKERSARRAATHEQA